ncbi:hypothetical protein HY639_04375 [Candidatus Woesearchaeota archaeon]|nr:hypothetical protein [Candidatus Woesearchaeota archaeon]
MTKGQAALEFLLLVSFMFLVFVSFFGVIQGRLADALDARARQAIQDELNVVQTEIKTAAAMEDGFQRVIELPATVNGRSYTVTLAGLRSTDKVAQELQLRYDDEPRYGSSFILPRNVDSSWMREESDTTTRKGGTYCLIKEQGLLHLEDDPNECTLLR